MEILYLWISKYKNLHNQGFNISNRYRFSFIIENKEVTIHENPNYIEKFFSNNISNLTAVVGENGTGKTNLLKFILNLVDGYGEDQPDCMIIFKHKHHIYIYHSPNIHIEKIPINFKKCKDLKDFSLNSTIVYYSNFFEPSSYQMLDTTKNQFSGHINLSTNYLLGTHFEKKFRKDNTIFNSPLNEALLAFSKTELHNSVRLIKKFHNNELLFKLPEYLMISINSEFEVRLNKNYSKLVDAFNKYYNPIQSPYNRFLYNYFRASVFSFLIFFSGEYEYNNKQKDFEYHLINLLKHSFEDKNTNFKEFIDNLSVSTALLIEYNDLLQSIISDSNKLLGLLSNFITPDKVDQQGLSISIKISEFKFDQLKEIIEFCFENERNLSFLEFSFAHTKFGDVSFSSGEYSILSFFSRLSSIEKKDLKSNTLLLIDESELALHPQWQKEFLNKAIDFIAELFLGKDIQIIITSHSPFLISDIPPHCIIFIEKINNVSVVIDGLKDHKSTFGANIHKLFTDTFFMKNGLIGDFALNKINKLIERVNQEDLSDGEIKLLLKEVNIIGDDYIRFKLEKTLLEKSSNDSIDIQIKEKYKEIEDLNKLKNDKNKSR